MFGCGSIPFLPFALYSSGEDKQDDSSLVLAHMCACVLEENELAYK